MQAASAYAWTLYVEARLASARDAVSGPERAGVADIAGGGSASVAQGGVYDGRRGRLSDDDGGGCGGVDGSGDDEGDDDDDLIR
eukprot:323610-Rhodomonas_salina.2